jgi:RNA polymerase sigma factor (sigma-70 family)
MSDPDARHRRAATPRAGGAHLDVSLLMRSATAGEAWAWEALIARFRPAVMAVARRHRLGHADQEDVTQRTWLALVANLHRINDPERVPGWLMTTARREALRVVGGLNRETPVAAHELPDEGEEVHFEERLSAAERGLALHRALDAVPARQRTLMRRLMAEPAPSYQQVSSELGIPVGSIGPTRQRCLDRLRADGPLNRALGLTHAPRHHDRGAERAARRPDHVHTRS